MHGYGAGFGTVSGNNGNGQNAAIVPSFNSASAPTGRAGLPIPAKVDGDFHAAR